MHQQITYAELAKKVTILDQEEQKAIKGGGYPWVDTPEDPDGNG
ncbi:MAG: hypothetical protein DHS20C18_32160 [Saprospiraceae bacterium]|nr:MAG: hypothetical protein DHS20C18_32160 [Saprospiraceae bacterium]